MAVHFQTVCSVQRGTTATARYVSLSSSGFNFKFALVLVVAITMVIYLAVYHTDMSTPGSQTFVYKLTRLGTRLRQVWLLNNYVDNPHFSDHD